MASGLSAARAERNMLNVSAMLVVEFAVLAMQQGGRLRVAHGHPTTDIRDHRFFGRKPHEPGRFPWFEQITYVTKLQLNRLRTQSRSRSLLLDFVQRLFPLMLLLLLSAPLHAMPHGCKRPDARSNGYDT